MVEALRAFRKIQIGKEATAGTSVAANEVLYGTLGSQESGEVMEYPDEERGSLARNMADDFVVGKEAHLVWTGDLNFRHILWALSMAIAGNVTPSTPITLQPNAKLWTLTPALTAANTPDQTNGIETCTIEYGDNVQAYEAEFAFATRIEISGGPNQPCKFTAALSARQQTDTTFTGSLTAQAVQRAPFNLAKLYINATGASLGTTQKTGLLKGFTWALDTMFTPRYTADGALYFTQLDEDKKRPELRLVYARNTDSDAERTKYEARTTTFLRLKLLGATELDSGQNNPPSLSLDGAYRYTAWPGPGGDGGLSTVEVTAEGVYDATWAKMFEALLLTNVTAWPT